MDIFLVVVKWRDAFQYRRVASAVLHPFGADAPNGSEYRKTGWDLGTTIYGFVYAKNGTGKAREGSNRGEEKRGGKNVTNRRHCRDCSSPVS